MLKKIKRRFNTIFFRVFGAFAVLILIFAVLLGTIFISIYRSTTENYNRQALARIANNVAVRFRDYVLDGDTDEYLEYFSSFAEFEDAEVWSFSNPNAAVPMDTSFESTTIQAVSDQREFKRMLEGAFDGATDIDTFYSEIHKSTAMVASVPILGEDREVCGAILMVQSLKEMDETINSSIKMILISSVLALALSALVATWMAKLISNPIKDMQIMAREMTEGNYECKTGIDRNDEIGDMARSIDKLSNRLKENEVERKNLEQMRMDFFANVSHELRTPIAVVRATTECLADGIVTEQSQVDEYHEKILRECKSMERLVADLLTLSKMQNPNFKVEKEPVNLVHIFDELIRSASEICREKNIGIVLNRDKDVYMMMGDYDRLRQMFMVIFDNAVKFSGENSQIHVTLRSGEDSEPMTVSIRDEGIGISKEELPFIFDKFYKSKLRMNAKGSGLGLAIAKNIALKHDGEIRVESEPGKGTDFIFSFREISEEEYMLSES